MTRARFVLGSESLRQRFDEVRAAVITGTRDAAALKEEIVSMRERVRSAHQSGAALSTSSTAPAAWSMRNLPCSTWCCPSPHNTRNSPAMWAILLCCSAQRRQGFSPGVGQAAATAYP